MQENEFEKKVQQKLDTLQVQPAIEVWQQVKKQLEEKKRKKRAAIFFLLASMLIITGLLLMNRSDVFNSGKRNVPVANKELAPAENDDNKQTGKNEKPVNDAVSVTKDLPVKIAPAGSNNNDITNISSLTTSNKGVYGSGKIKRTLKHTTRVITNAPGVGEEGTKNNMAAIEEDEGEKPGVKVKDNSSVTGDNTVIKADENATAIIVNGKRIDEKKEAELTKKQTKEEKKDIHKWTVSLLLSGGVSATGNSYLSNGLYEQDGLGSTPTTGSPNGSAYTPSRTSPGFSFMTGIQVSRNISPVVSVSTGLQYRMFTTTIKTGQRLDLDSSGLRNFFAYGTANNYVNRYHFIALPVTFSARLCSISGRDVNADAGVSVSWLLSTNALNFNQSNGLYYKNNSLFNKTQLGVHAALRYNLAGKNMPAFYIGPEFYYGVTPLASTGIYVDAHTKYAGIRLQKNLKN